MRLDAFWGLPPILLLLLGPGLPGVAQELPAAEPPRGEPAAEVLLEFPLGIALGPDGAVYVSERQGHRVRRLDPTTGRVTTVAVTGERGFSGDGGPALESSLMGPYFVRAESANGILLTDTDSHRIRRLDLEP